MPYKDRQTQNAYIRETTVQVGLRFSKSREPEVVDWIRRQEQPAAVIKEVLREHIKKEKEGAE